MSSRSQTSRFQPLLNHGIFWCWWPTSPKLYKAHSTLTSRYSTNTFTDNVKLKSLGYIKIYVTIIHARQIKWFCAIRSSPSAYNGKNHKHNWHTYWYPQTQSVLMCNTHSIKLKVQKIQSEHKCLSIKEVSYMGWLKYRAFIRLITKIESKN